MYTRLRTALLSSFLVAMFAILGYIGTARADVDIIVDLPVGNSTGAVYPSGSTPCLAIPYQQVDWGHSLAYSVENFINPQHIHFKYLDFYGGYHNKPGANMRWYLPYLREYYTSTKLPLNALHNQPLTVYDVTMWLWVYYPHYSYADAPWFEFANGFPDFNCGSYTHTYFFP